ncbi:MAG: hypothetical protein H7338_10595 [Candidatus Sericytochromatia bacterium]|nr:hypothetical protein [Candidatus Sericytochromatia bacterium]
MSLQPATIHQLDHDGMLALTDRSPARAESAFRQAQTLAAAVTKLAAGCQNVFICGMGGSAISGDLWRASLGQQESRPMTVQRGPGLPAWVCPDTLAVFLSYSGNTAETLDAYHRAQETGCRIVGISSGGQLSRSLRESGRLLVPVPPGMQPRAALPEIFFSLLGATSLCDGLTPGERAAVAAWEAMAKVVSAEGNGQDGQAQALARSFNETTPYLLGLTPHTVAVAQRWQTQINENAKLMALVAAFPEMTHNEIVPLHAMTPAPYHLVLFRESETHPLVRAQLDITLAMLADRWQGVSELEGSGGPLLARQMSLVTLGDYVSIYQALLRGLDPTPVGAIQQLKARMQAASPASP